MGITGLLKLLEEEKVCERINISTLAGRTLAIDTYCWLHKGAFSVADKLARNEKTDGHIDYCLKYVDKLLSHRIKPILVFDGQHLPAKADTESKRREIRHAARKRAAELLRLGDYSEARKFQRQCVDITHEMALRLIRKCRDINVDCIVAPYEADAQLAYLNKIGIADYIVTEDSDLILFGCRKILFKLDLFGNCDLVDIEKLHLAMNCPKERFVMDKFRLMCILSGCDYIESLQGIGLKKALKFVKATEETDLMRALDRIPSFLKMRQLNITEEYKVNVLKARATFLHMVVFDPGQRKQVRLNEIDELGTDEKYCSNAGVILEDQTKALNLAVGNIDPFTFEKLDDWHPSKVKTTATMNKKGLKVDKHPSIWNRNYQWMTTLNGASTSTAPKLTPTKKPTKPTKRIIDKLMESDSDDENKPTESQNDEMVLNEYIGLNEPLPKRFRDNADSDEQPCEAQQNGQDDAIYSASTCKQITPNRNPFKKTDPCTDILLSPTRISKENNSLVKTQSPVKNIDYVKLRKLNKFSKYDRTVVSDQKVLSRYFPAGGVSASKSPSTNQESSSVTKNENSSVKKEPKSTLTSPNLLGTQMATPHPALYFTKSIGSPDLMEKSPMNSSIANDMKDDDDDDDDDDPVNDQSQRIILEKFKYVLKDRIAERNSDEPTNSQGASDQTDSETNELPIVLTDDDDEDSGLVCSGNSASQELSNRNWLSSSQKSKTNTKQKKATTQRKKSTSSNNKSSIKTCKDSSQRRLTTMFGFEKKSQIQL